MASTIKFKTIYLEKNQGHGVARRRGLAECSNDLVAIMDSDDISFPRRFEKQIEAFNADSELSVVGGQMTEFIGVPTNVTGVREAALNDADIKRDMRKRCPFNQVTAMFKKTAVDAVGGYVDWYCEEDYYLWTRMALADCVFANVPEVLVNVRVGDEMSARRGGLKYFLSEARLQGFMLRKGLIALPRYLYNVAIRLIAEVLLPNSLRVKLFRFTRKEFDREKYASLFDDVATAESSASPSDYPSFSVAMCVYGGDNAEWFDEALRSVVEQTVKPSEIVLVVDGPIPEAIRNVIAKYENLCERAEAA